MQTQTQQTTAAALYAAFERGTRDNGEAFYSLKDGSPQWMTDAVHNAHDAVDELPDDEAYDCCRSAASAIADGADEDSAGEFADGEVSVYHAGRVAWLAAHPHSRLSICDAAADEMGADSASISDRIAYGWYEWARRIYDAIATACEEQAETENDEADEETGEDA